MAKKLREGDGKAGIARAGKRKLGYDTTQVDAFLERAHTLYDSEGINLTQQDIQSVSFELAKDGYVISQVDAALHRLEQAVVDKQTAWEIGQQGRVAWKAQTEKLYQKVASHVERAPRERFKPGAPKQPSYDKKQVDRIADQVVDKAAAALGVDGVTQNDVKGLADLNADAVNNIIFTQRKGKKGYDERQVDYFLNVCVQLLSRIESYARISDYVANGGTTANQSADTSHNASDQVTPLIANDTQRSTAAVPQAAAAVAGESFDALRQAEQNLFPAPATAQAEAQSGVSGSAPSVPSAYTPQTINQVSTASNASAVPVQAPSSTQSAVQSPTVQYPSVQQNRQALPVPSPSSDAPATVSASVRHDAFESADQVPPSFDPQPKPAATAAEPAQQAASPSANRNLTDGNPSLAALAHMAEVSQELPAVDASSFTPKMPSLNTPSALKLNTEPAANVANAVNTFTPAEQPAPQAQSAAASHAASPVTPAVQPATPSAPDMLVSFAPAVKPERNTGSVAVPVVTQSAAQFAPQSASTPAAPVGTQSPVEPQSQTGRPTSELPAAEETDNQHETKFNTLFPLIPNFDDDFGNSIPDLSFPTLNDDDTKKEQ